MGKSKQWIGLMLLFTLAFGVSIQGNPSFATELGFAPVSGYITSPFGWRTDPMNGSQRFHGGIDIAAQSGMPVYAPQAGVVAYSGYYGGYGNVVVLNHGNSLYTLYGHNSKLLVQAGQQIARGQLISQVGSTGRSTGPHLHFEVHYNGQYQNPLTYLSYLQQQGLAIVPQSTIVPERHTIGLINPTRYKRGSYRKHGGKTVQLVSGTDVENLEF